MVGEHNPMTEAIWYSLTSIYTTVEPGNADSLNTDTSINRTLPLGPQKTYVDYALVTPLNCVHLDIP